MTPYRAKQLWREKAPFGEFPTLTIPEDAYVGRVSRLLNSTSWVEALFAIAAGKLVAMGAFVMADEPDDGCGRTGPFEVISVDHVQSMALVRDPAREGSPPFPLNVEHLSAARYAGKDLG